MNLGIRRPLVYYKFPSTSILDDFNRANEGPPPSANWTGPWMTTGSDVRVISNAVASGSGFINSVYWNPGTFGPNSEVFLSSVAGQGNFFIGLRIVQPGAATVDGYVAHYDGGSNSTIERLDNGVSTQLGASASFAITAGRKLGLAATGSSLVLYGFDSSWSSLRTTSDATYSAAGNVGIATGITSGSFDDFGGGTII